MDCHKLIFADPKHEAITGQPLGDVDEGSKLFARLCSGCHGATGEKKVGDGVVINSEEFFSRHDEASILIQIAEGRHGAMTGFVQERNGPLSWAQILDLVAFITSWKPAIPATPPPVAPVGDVDHGATLYATNCAACHGTAGEGGTLAKKPLNSPEYLTTHSDEEIQRAIAEGIPGTVMPAYGDKLTLDDIADLIAFFRSWQ